MLPTLLDVIDLGQRPRLASLLREFDSVGGVLDYVPFAVSRPPECEDHQNYAVEALRYIDRACELWASQKATADCSVEKFFRVHVHHRPEGRSIPLREFWGTADVASKEIGLNVLAIPAIDGYKSAFFHPPYGLSRCPKDIAMLFDSINAEIFGAESDLKDLQIWSWTTDCSNYFDAGHEWWGAYLWTVYSPAAGLITTIGASTTD